jgi:hypothetical protein
MVAQFVLCSIVTLSAISTSSLSLGLIGMGDPSSLASTSGALRAFNVPLISASPEHAETLSKEDNVLTTAPDMSGQARVRQLLFKCCFH